MTECIFRTRTLGPAVDFAPRQLGRATDEGAIESVLGQRQRRREGGADFSGLFSGAILTETVFAYQGVGKLVYDSIIGND